ncbi:metallophosphoesterase [Paenibacillus hexagrammi]|uniref:Metallophosphoesterase n=1 Tax=Paenibacillus hexagrammi TaxID=2908839 RepID=A0ABY3SMK7_9BACL|nr:metallophosphoesterase [Paenibacillus sp. YPD9-1]UJF35288.1 metallophosphoesterase [Paenibacillus sp. YPD9-1]
MKGRFAVTFGIILLIVGVVNGYIGWHGHVFLAHLMGSYYVPSVYWIIFWIASLSYLLAWLGKKIMPYGISSLFKQIGSYWFACMQFGLLLLPLADLSAWLLHLASVPSDTYVRAIGSVILLIWALIFIRGSYNARSPIIRKYEITIPKQAGDWSQLRIAVASDIHLGTVVGNKHLQKLVDRLTLMQPDLILLPGDVIDDDIRPFIRKRMGEVMRQLKAPLGVFAVLGNHEYIGGHIPAYVAEMNKIGIRVLMDEVVLLADRLYVAGRKDKASEGMSDGRMPLEQLVKGLDPNKPLIVMDHQPYHLDRAAAAGADVMLSGHTHRGQLAPNHLITGRLFELDWGYLRKGDFHAIVSSGFGTWGPPLRLGSRSEIIELVIHFRQEERKEGL